LPAKSPAEVCFWRLQWEIRPLAGLRRLQSDRRQVRVHRQRCVTEQSIVRCRRKRVRGSWEPHPRHPAALKASIEYAATPDWKIGGNVTAVGSQFYVGDDGNQNSKLPAYWVANLYTSYQVSKEVQLFALVNNLFDQRYSTYGTYFSPEGVANAISNPPTDPRTQTPAQPLSIYAGVRIRL
jgi:outer membrane receptor protein involved in Fe transport